MGLFIVSVALVRMIGMRRYGKLMEIMAGNPNRGYCGAVVCKKGFATEG